MVKAKFKVFTKHTADRKSAVILFPVVDGNKENDEYFKNISSGSMELCIVNEEEAKQFVVGEEVYVEFNFSINNYKT